MKHISAHMVLAGWKLPTLVDVNVESFDVDINEGVCAQLECYRLVAA